MYTGLLTQNATVWPPQSPDGHEVPAAPPVAALCRWEDHVERAVDSTGREFVSRAVVYFPDEQDVDSFVLLGTSTLADPIDAGAVRIRSIGRSQSPGGSIVVWKAVCG